MHFKAFTAIFLVAITAASCVHDPLGPVSPIGPTPLVIEKALGLPPFEDDPDNPLTVEGVELGKMLFYDPLLSADYTMSCGSCHEQANGFTDEGRALSIGIDGIEGARNSMPIFNLNYAPDFSTTEGGLPVGGFFWDSRSADLEVQALIPIEDEVEMHNTLGEVVDRIQAHESYPLMFEAAFGTSIVTPDLVAKAIVQFERTIISGNAPFDKYNKGVELWDDDVFDGKTFFDELEPFGADCLHCHGENGGLFTDYTYRNNGLDPYTNAADFPDRGLMAVTGDTADAGKFKVPTLRNIALTAPYMHDGRFETLREVIDFYSEGVHDTPFTDPLMNYAADGGGNFTEEQKDLLEAFLISLTDEEMLTNPDYKDPF